VYRRKIGMHIDLVRSVVAVVIPVVVLSSGGCAALTNADEVLNEFPYIDSVVFGDDISEQSHNVSAPKTIAVTGGLGECARKILPGGSLSFELKCDPDKQNYLTVQLWGSDSGSGMLFLARPIQSEYGSAWCELDYMKDDFGYLRQDAERAFPGRFYYSTYPIPAFLTRNRETVRLTIISTGGANPYASGADRTSKQVEASRGIYAAYIHTDPFFEPPETVPVGEDPGLGEPLRSRDGVTAHEHLRREINRGIRTILSWQFYGPEWDERVARGDAPAVMTGAVSFGGKQGNSSWSVQEWKDNLYVATVSTGNCAPMNALDLYAEAYLADWSDYKGNNELVDRVVKGLDFYVRAQGLNGGFHDGDRTYMWIGAPNRRNAVSCLEGFGTMSLGRAFALLSRQIQALGYLDELIDHDDNPDTPPVTRANAYTAMFVALRDYVVTERGHAPNQDLAQILAMFWANEALKTLSPEDVWSEGKVLEYAYSAAGITEDIYGGRWLSSKGMPLEPNGTSGGAYSSGYGVNCLALLAQLAEATSDEAIQQKTRDAVEAMSYFFYLTRDVRGNICVANDGVISWRNNSTPGRINYGSDVCIGVPAYAALELGVPAAQRLAKLLLEHNRVYEVNLSKPAAHYMNYIHNAIDLLENLDSLAALPDTGYRLPMEPESPDFAWVDEEAGNVAIKHGEARIYMCLNWRHNPGSPRSPHNASVNNIARIHMTTPAVDRIANAIMSSEDGYFGLWTVKYGRYLVAINRSADTTYQIELPAGFGSATDLVSGQSFDRGSVPGLAPGASYVLYLEDSV